MNILIRPAQGAADMAAAATLFRRYVDWLGVDLDFQDFEAELAGLPGLYRPPGGDLLLAVRPGVGLGMGLGDAVGCVAVKPLPKLGPGICEMKRLYVLPEAQGGGLGRRLAEAIIERARELGHRTMVLDTLDRLTAAIALYERLGFADCPPYYANPLPGVRYMQRAL